MTTLTPDLAGRFARITLGHIGQQYPYKLDQVLAGPQDVRPPVDLHPIFHGSFDWHSCVHGWWQLLTIRRLFPTLPEAAAIAARADMMLIPERVAGERARLDQPFAAGFERPYGWAWLLALHAEACRHDAPWGEALAPLAQAFAARFRDFLPKLTYPIRTGTHFNTAFALVLARDWAMTRDAALVALIDERAQAWFLGDRGCQAWEPSGDDFLSSALTEALLMRHVLPAPAFATWFAAFLPDLDRGEPATLFHPVTVSDRSDGKIAHLDGLNLSRAWCWRAIAVGHPLEDRLGEVADRHLVASLPHLDDDYMGSHWLATFALLATAGLGPAVPAHAIGASVPAG
ncbi:DUF2891 domain-containing protein [Sphingomonas sp. Leaf25]|uniref:DUF2891 domain-containing protein n=1 Tax=Sphingomonas sp. Leaf25 TaxID=1735692 RepID=UPI0006FEF853|nr:DUF2891 domain-containing protein [Sphingomonas sp. Leaf25]KQM96703.1 hypothetical protein ASE78_12110 [Sphingomonas sp. Leaf25]